LLRAWIDYIEIAQGRSRAELLLARGRDRLHLALFTVRRRLLRLLAGLGSITLGVEWGMTRLDAACSRAGIDYLEKRSAAL
jgi:hypothetical protein